MHLFRSQQSHDKDDWFDGELNAHGSEVRLPRDVIMFQLAEWHYRHAVILAWGASGLKAKAHPQCFHEAGVYGFANCYNSEELTDSFYASSLDTSADCYGSPEETYNCDCRMN